MLIALAELWDPRYIVIDATGVGAGLSSFLEKAYPTKVLPFLFNSATKSVLGRDYLAVVETGRYKEYKLPSPGIGRGAGGEGGLQQLFWKQVSSTQMDISVGPNRSMKWGVPDGARDQSTGELIHDDLVISAALCSLLDDQQWGTAESSVVIAQDPLSDLGDVF